MIENETGTCVIDSAIQIYRETGPGLLETVYEVILAHPLRERGFQVEQQVAIPLLKLAFTSVATAGVSALNVFGRARLLACT